MNYFFTQLILNSSITFFSTRILQTNRINEIINEFDEEKKEIRVNKSKLKASRNWSTMEMENDVIRLAGELSVAVEVIMDPNVSQQARMDAYIACEKYETILFHL